MTHARSRPRAARATTLLALALALALGLAFGGAAPASALAGGPARTARRDAGAPASPIQPASAPVGGGAAPVGGATAPSDAAGLDASSAPPLTADASASAPESGGDPLADNGFGSVLCRESTFERSLSAAAQGNCATSSFVAAAAPTGNYAFDVHIDTGILSAFNGDLVASCIQDFVLVPVWTALVWIIHALLVGIEWCYTLDLLDGATLGSIASALRAVQATLTQPLMAFALAAASVLALYHGIVRRRVAQTLAEVLVMLVMMAGGLWVVLDPVGTIGTLGQWADQTSLGVLGAVTAGEPASGDQSLASGSGELFTSAIGGPWCYLEFGDVDWCRDADRLDPRLRSAAQAIAVQERRSSTASQRTSAALLGRAQTNGDLFLALPANGPQRNSINDTGSLLRVLCGSSDATSCIGPTASEAEFRTAGGTLARAGGLLLVVVGVAGLIAVLTFVVGRLLGAAVATLLYLLLAPIAVLAPAFGEGGRAAFRTWAARLLGALVAKLVYSLVLGILLLVLRIVEGLSTLGWWTQWLLMSCLWWTAFHRRHQLLEYVNAPRAQTVASGSGRGRAARAGPAWLYGRELRRLLRELRPERTPPEIRRRPPTGPYPDPRAPGQPPDETPGRDGDGRVPRDGGPDRRGGDDGRPAPPSEDGESPIASADGSVTSDDAHDDGHDRAAGPSRPAAGSDGAPRLRSGSPTARLARLVRETQLAHAAGDTRRALSLERRAEALRAQVRSGDWPSAADGDRSSGGPRAVRLPADQLSLGGVSGSRGGGVAHDQRLPASLAGPASGARSHAADRGKARGAIDRELDERRRSGAERAGSSRAGADTDARSRAPAAGGATTAAAGTPRPPATPVRAAAVGLDGGAIGPRPITGRAGRADGTARVERAVTRTADDSIVVRRERQFAEAFGRERVGQGADDPPAVGEPDRPDEPA